MVRPRRANRRVTRSSKRKRPAGLRATKRGKSFLPTVRRIARQAVRRATEDKQFGTGAIDLNPGPAPSIYGSANFDANNIIDVSGKSWDAVIQGVNQQQRIGNKITCRSCVLRGTVYVEPGVNDTDTLGFGPYEVKLWVVSHRSLPNSATVADIRGVFSGTSFDQGNSNVGLSGRLFDHMLKINDEQLKVYMTRTFKIGCSFAPWNIQQNGLIGNNDYAINRKFTLRLGRYTNRLIRYNDQNQVPRNKRLFVVFSVVPAVGGIAQVSDQVRLTYNVLSKWEDN